MITQEYLKSVLNYNPDTGIFTWLNPRNRPLKKRGGIAGYINSIKYRVIKTNGKAYLAHRLAWLYMTGSFPKNQIDHLNKIRGDNRWANLKGVTNAENCRNKSISKNNKSGISGVHFCNQAKRWRVVITFKGVVYRFGSYRLLDEAIEVRHREIKQFDFSPTHGI